MSGKLLDVGCSLGIFLDEAQKAGWDVQGIEPSQWCAEQGKKLFGLSIAQGTYRNIPELAQQFDVITMWDVLEHLDSPMDALRISHSALKDDGILAFSTVDIGSWYARFLGQKWPWLMTMHIYYFDRKRIRQYLEKAGFKLLQIRKYKHIVSGEYLLYKLKRINKILFFLMNIFYRICRLFKKEIFVTIALGDFMEVYAQKTLPEKGCGTKQ
jgi:2-polyprenyl-3-methyl-5-hydroxy-6-metoxy-1,4-benzoquinol methylase